MIVRYSVDGSPAAWGRLTSPPPTSPDDKLDLVNLVTEAVTTNELIAALGESTISDGPARRIRAASVRSPITSDATLVCQGLNYDDHAHESGHGMRKENLLFGKASSALSGPYEDIVRPAGVELLDFEVEVGVVLRTDLRASSSVGESDLGAQVAGVVLCNDVSARDVMFGASFLQWYQGKSYRTFCPTGPVLYLLEPDEVSKTLANLEISLVYKGETRQSATTSHMIYKPVETLKQIAQIMDLKRGDVILTGTPGGVLARATPSVVEILRTRLMDDVERRAELCAEMKTMSEFLKPGDVVTLRLRDLSEQRELGGQSTRVVAAGEAPR
jgi:2-keto-4-pentenoate hydratase/2-oxohepta-3-ene-1,7-dioic acid hydratase in catechol pathway